MINSTITNQTTNGKHLGLCRAVLLATALLGLLPALQASDWGFNLIGQPSAAKTEEPGEAEEHEVPEVIQMTGAGKFNPEAQTASGGGSWTVLNGTDAIDEFFGGTPFHGTWQVTKFISWTPDGGLQVLVTL